MKTRLILNGKKAQIPELRQAVLNYKKKQDFQVRVTWDANDLKNLIQEGVELGFEKFIIGGGDGSLNEAVIGIMELPEEKRPIISALPLGTANDFATACNIPKNYSEALDLAFHGNVHEIDCVKANDSYFLNVASGGFGAQVTTTTPVALKNFLGGGAYTISGLIQVLNFEPYEGQIILEDEVITKKTLVGALCNSIQAGGGQILAPDAKINDGFANLFLIHEFPADALGQVIDDFKSNAKNSEYVRRIKAKKFEWVAQEVAPINLDGEPISEKKVVFEVMENSIKMVLPKDCPVLV